MGSQAKGGSNAKCVIAFDGFTVCDTQVVCVQRTHNTLMQCVFKWTGFEYAWTLPDVKIVIIIFILLENICEVNILKWW